MKYSQSIDYGGGMRQQQKAAGNSSRGWGWGGEGRSSPSAVTKSVVSCCRDRPVAGNSRCHCPCTAAARDRRDISSSGPGTARRTAHHTPRPDETGGEGCYIQRATEWTPAPTGTGTERRTAHHTPRPDETGGEGCYIGTARDRRDPSSSGAEV